MMNMLDEIDKKIISILIRDGRKTYKEIGDEIGYTIMGAKRRIQKMLSSGLIEISASLNVKKMNLHMALILLEMENRDSIVKCLERFRECPRIISMFTLLSGYNLAALIIAENMDTLESESMERCSLRCAEGVRRSEFYPIGSIYYHPYLKLRLNLFTRIRVKAPCGVDCSKCTRYMDEKCLGCPATKYYRGPL